VKNKRGVEQPQVIVYVLFVTVLTLAGMYVAFTMLGGVGISFKYQDSNARLNSAAAKMIFTPECFALESQYDDYADINKKHYQVESGTINWNKFSATSQIASSCVSDKSQVFVEIKDIDDTFKDIAWTCPAPLSSDCPEPPNRIAWKGAPRSYFVLINRRDLVNNVYVISKGIMTVRLKA